MGGASRIVAAVNTSVVIRCLAGTAGAVPSYYVDQVVNYGGACEQPDLFDDTALIVQEMMGDGWPGEKWVDADAWPQDFRESCSSSYGSGGIDNQYGDNHNFVIFSGHGSANKLYYGAAHDSVCNHLMGTNGRVGSMSGAKAAVAMYAACEVLNPATAPAGANFQWLRQQLGFQGLVGNAVFQYSWFYEDTDSFLPPFGKSNADAWHDRLGPMGASAITISYGTSSSNCWSVHNNAKLKRQVHVTPRSGGPACGAGQPAFVWCWSY